MNIYQFLQTCSGVRRFHPVLVFYDSNLVSIVYNTVPVHLAIRVKHQSLSTTTLATPQAAASNHPVVQIAQHTFIVVGDDNAGTVRPTNAIASPVPSIKFNGTAINLHCVDAVRDLNHSECLMNQFKTAETEWKQTKKGAYFYNAWRK